MRAVGLVVALCIAGGASDARALALGQLDDFQDGTTQGWFGGGGDGIVNPNPPTAILDGGPLGAGDAFLQIESSGFPGPGSRLVGLNRDQWSGDYLAAGVTSLFLDLRNPGDTDLFVRVALVRLSVTGARIAVVSASSVFLPAGSGWESAHFDLTSDGLVEFSGASLGFVLADVFELRILSAELPEFRGDTVAGTLWVDNVFAAPEPRALALLLLAAGAPALRRRRPGG